MCVCLLIPLSGFAESFNNSVFSSWNCGLHRLQIKITHKCTPITYTSQQKGVIKPQKTKGNIKEFVIAIIYSGKEDTSCR